MYLIVGSVPITLYTPAYVKSPELVVVVGVQNQKGVDFINRDLFIW